MKKFILFSLTTALVFFGTTALSANSQIIKTNPFSPSGLSLPGNSESLSVAYSNARDSNELLLNHDTFEASTIPLILFSQSFIPIEYTSAAINANSNSASGSATYDTMTTTGSLSLTGSNSFSGIFFKKIYIQAENIHFLDNSDIYVFVEDNWILVKAIYSDANGLYVNFPLK